MSKKSSKDKTETNVFLSRDVGLGVQPHKKQNKTGIYYGAQSMRTTFVVITAGKKYEKGTSNCVEASSLLLACNLTTVVSKHKL